MVTQRTLFCPGTADYSQIASDVILPFVFALDLTQSILEPAEGENQRFCYTITANGEDTNAYADLSHFVLGICENIPADQLGAITVIRDGEPQTVIFGVNVELKSTANPDPTTGCAGLKFDFGLNKVSGTMRVCFELLTPYPVGAVRVCVKGGTTALNNLFVCGPSCEEPQQTCATTVYQRARVCVPVTITPWAYAGETETYCCGEAVIVPGTVPCGGTPLSTCSFTITRELCVAVPVFFGAQAQTGEANTECIGASAVQTCESCGAS